MKRVVVGKNIFVGLYWEVVVYVVFDILMNISVFVIMGLIIVVIVLEWFIYFILMGFFICVFMYNFGWLGFFLDVCCRVDIYVSKGGVEFVCKSWYGFSFIDVGWFKLIWSVIK